MDGKMKSSPRVSRDRARNPDPSGTDGLFTKPLELRTPMIGGMIGNGEEG
jgi:hypothetical protein